MDTVKLNKWKDDIILHLCKTLLQFLYKIASTSSKFNRRCEWYNKKTVTILVNKNLVISQKTRACYQAARVEQLKAVDRRILFIEYQSFFAVVWFGATCPPPPLQASVGELYIQGVERQRVGPLDKMQSSGDSVYNRRKHKLERLGLWFLKGEACMIAIHVSSCLQPLRRFKSLVSCEIHILL